MKKYLLFLIICSNINVQSYGQFGQCQQWLTPNGAARGQTLTTTISGTQFFNGYGSAPCDPSEVYLYQSSTATTIYATSLSMQNDSVRVSWNIPSNAPIGAYDLNLYIYGFTPFGSCLGSPYFCSRPQAFGIGTSIISGSVYYDANQDSVFNTGDGMLSNRRVLILPENIITLTNTIGGYSFFTDTGAHTIVVLPQPSFNSVSSDSININVGNSNIDSIDFAIYPTVINYDSRVYLVGRPRCNTTQNYNLTYSSATVVPVNLLIKLFHSSNTPYVSSSLPPDSIVGDTIYFSVLNFVNYFGSGTIGIQFQIPSAGDTVVFGAILESYDLSGNLVSSSMVYPQNQLVRCSYDPNDKNVIPQGIEAQHYTLMDEELFYTIRFQNTGNDTAYDIHIIDTLNINLDLTTLQIISNSHPLILELNSNGVANFIMNNIMLPDSFVDEPASNGYISYTIRHLDPIPDFTEIANQAYIYFDQNAPVVTNRTFNTFVTNMPVGIFDPVDQDDVAFYPNPFNESVAIISKDNKTFSHILTITDIQGREIVNMSITSTNPVIDLHNLSSGVYIYKLFSKTDNLLYIGKLIKQ